MTQPGGEQPHFTSEHFHDPTPATRETFDTTVERLQGEFAEHTTTLRRDYISNYAGDFDGHHASFHASIEEWYAPNNEEKTRSRAGLSISIATSIDPPISIGELVANVDRLFSMQPPKKREFSYGEVRGDMTDAEYNAAVLYLRQTVPADDWAWVEKARLFASEPYDATFLPFAVNELLDTSPSRPPVCRMKEYFLDPLNFKNGMRLQVVWMEANPAYIQQLGPYEVARQVTIAMPTNEKYVYFAFTDGTEQMLVETKDPVMFAQLSAQGVAVMDSSDGIGWAAITPEQRRAGIQAPSDVLMGRFKILIDSAIESGTSNE